MVHNHFQLHLDEGHLLLGGDDHQGAVLHLAGHVGLLPGEGLCAVEVEAGHEGGLHPPVGHITLVCGRFASRSPRL